MLEAQKTNGPSEGTMPFWQHPGLRSACQEPREVERAALLRHRKEKEEKKNNDHTATLSGLVQPWMLLCSEFSGSIYISVIMCTPLQSGK